jgi:hypothetical protein
MPQTNRHMRPLFNSCHGLAHPLQCHSHHRLSVPPSKLNQTSIMACYAPLPTDYSRPSPTERQAPAWPQRGTRIVSTTWNSKFCTTSKPLTGHPWVTSSTLGRSATSRSRWAMGYTKKPNGYGSMTTAPSPAITVPRGPTNSPTSLTYMPPPTTASTHPSNRFQRGSDICSPVQVVTFKSCRRPWPTLEIGASPEKSLAIASLMTTSWQWPSRLKSTSGIWTLPVPASDHVSPNLCLPGLRRGSPPYKTCQGRLECCAWGGRRPLACHKGFMSKRHHWRMSRDVWGRPL